MSEHLVLSLIAFTLLMATNGIAYGLGYRDGYAARKRLEFRERVEARQAFTVKVKERTPNAS
jgi:hypothetical protein